jgi:outer membrane protein assembly factor BamE (lipoprotein component of BamABCDE complex)
MQAKSWAVSALGLCGLLACARGAAVSAAAAAGTATGTAAGKAQGAGVSAQSIAPALLAKIVPGISKGQVKSLLGEPWRTVQYNDLDEVENEIWEYRGKDAHGTYRVHIEFNKQGTVVVVGKIPDAGAPKGTPAKS